MAKIKIVGAKPRKVVILDQPKRRIDPTELADALGAKSTGLQVAGDLDPIALAELGTQLLNRLRSSGGRPALEDATFNCRVPLSAEDVKTLETILSHIGESTGVKPSVGQLTSVIVRLQLNALKGAALSADSTDIARDQMEKNIFRGILQQMIDEQINPIREQVEKVGKGIARHCPHSLVIVSSKLSRIFATPNHAACSTGSIFSGCEYFPTFTTSAAAGRASFSIQAELCDRLPVRVSASPFRVGRRTKHRFHSEFDLSRRWGRPYRGRDYALCRN